MVWKGSYVSILTVVLTLTVIVLSGRGQSVARNAAMHSAADNPSSGELKSFAPAADNASESVESMADCGCGNYDCSPDSVVNLSDYNTLMDHLYLSHSPLPGDDIDMNMDQCDGVDIADMFALLDHIYMSKTEYCNGSVDCGFEGIGDTVELVVVRQPSVSSGQMELQLDLYVRNHRSAVAANLGFGWDNPNMVFDSALTMTLITDAWSAGNRAEGSTADRRFQFWGGHSLLIGLDADNTQKRHWASYYFTLTDWDVSDSIVVDTAYWEGGCTFKLVTGPGDQTHLDSLGYIPAWQGGLTIRDPLALDCGCGNINCDPLGKANEADFTLLVDYLYLSHNPFPASEGDANLDQCDGVDFVDLVALLDHIYVSQTPYCDGMVDCDFEGVGDTVALVVAQRPEVSTGSTSLQLDLYVRNHRRLGGVNMSFGWDNPDMTYDSVALAPLLVDNFDFYPLVTGSTPEKRLLCRGASFSQPGLPADDTQRRLWASYYFTLSSWSESDSILIDTAYWEGGCTFKLITGPGDESHPDSLGYVPAWGGGIVVRDPSVCGNVNGIGGVDLADVIYLIDYFYTGGPPPTQPDIANVDMCQGVDVGDLVHLIDYVMRAGPAPCAVGKECDCVVPDDHIVIEEHILDENHLRLDLSVSNSRPLLGASMGFSWDDPNVVLDSAVATASIISAFDEGPHFFENDDIATTNVNQRCLFSAVRRESGTGLEVQSEQLWASYYFSSSTKILAGIEMLVDTLTFSEASAYKLIIEEGDGSCTPYQPILNSNWFCCGRYTDGYSGNINWNEDRTGCDESGRRDLADISRLIDHVYLSKRPLCCRTDGNVNGDPEGKVNLADISRLIDHVFISKEETAACP